MLVMPETEVYEENTELDGIFIPVTSSNRFVVTVCSSNSKPQKSVG